MNHIMVDLETMDTGTEALVLSIGAVAFDPKTGELGNQFYVELNHDDVVEQQTNLGRTMSQATIKWWAEQDDAARKLFDEGFGNRAVTLEKALAGFTEFVHGEAIGSYKDVMVWGNGAAFDNVILRNLYAAAGIKPPWMFYNDRCFRTFKALTGAGALKPEFVGTPHYALDDALNQTQHLLEIFKCLGTTQLSA